MRRYVRRYLPEEEADEMSPTGSMTLGVPFSATRGFQKTTLKLIDSAEQS
jgi:hypothetical protein